MHNRSGNEIRNANERGPWPRGGAVRHAVACYFEACLAEHGPVPRGVDWNSARAQEVRFEQLLRILDDDEPVSITDYGCGYGALWGYLKRLNRPVVYQGYDLSPRMIDEARRLNGIGRDRAFTHRPEKLVQTDFVVASGVFNVRGEIDRARWERHVLAELAELDRLCLRGFAFNALTRYADEERMEERLYYADPGQYLDYCVRRFSRHVAVLQDYGLYDFTVLVRKAASPSRQDEKNAPGGDLVDPAQADA